MKLLIVQSSPGSRYFPPSFGSNILFTPLYSIHGLYSSSDTVKMIKSRRMRWAEHVTYMGRGEVSTWFWLGRPEGKRSLGRPKRRWVYNIKMDLREIGIDGANWIRLGQDRAQCRDFVRTVMNLRIP
jgi:hypothetical protein